MSPADGATEDKRVTYVTDAVRAFIGVESEMTRCCDVVEPGAVRRFAQAIMDLDPAYADADYAATTPYGRPVAPPLYPFTQSRIPFDGPDVVSEFAEDPDYDGAGIPKGMNVLPPLPLGNLAVLNGGSKVELLRYLHHGEALWFKSRYEDIYERESAKGPMVMVIIATDYFDRDGNRVASIQRTSIRR